MKNPSKFVLYEDFDGFLIGYTDQPHICRINGKIHRPQKLKSWTKSLDIDLRTDLNMKFYQTMVQFEQRWTMYSSHSQDTTTISTGIVNDYNNELELEYVSKSEMQNMFQNRGKNSLQRQNKV